MLKRLPPAIQFRDIIDVGVGGGRLKRNQFCHQFRHTHATLRGALLQRRCSIKIDFDGLGFHW
jgi:hypothetical protein